MEARSLVSGSSPRPPASGFGAFLRKLLRLIVLSKVKGHILGAARESDAELCVAFLFLNERATRFSDKSWALQEFRFKPCPV